MDHSDGLRREELWGQPGKIKVTGFLSRGRAGLFAADSVLDDNRPRWLSSKEHRPCQERIRSGFASQVLLIHVLNELDRFHLVGDVIDRIAPATTTSMCAKKAPPRRRSTCAPVGQPVDRPRVTVEGKHDWLELDRFDRKIWYRRSTPRDA
jgi:hypothetical protein